MFGLGLGRESEKKKKNEGLTKVGLNPLLVWKIVFKFNKREKERSGVTSSKIKTLTKSSIKICYWAYLH